MDEDMKQTSEKSSSSCGLLNLLSVILRLLIFCFYLLRVHVYLTKDKNSFTKKRYMHTSLKTGRFGKFRHWNWCKCAQAVVSWICTHNRAESLQHKYSWSAQESIEKEKKQQQKASRYPLGNISNSKLLKITKKKKTHWKTGFQAQPLFCYLWQTARHLGNLSRR